jgi:SAM-dependent methyltransferase
VPDSRSQNAYYNAYWAGAGGWKPTDSLDAELAHWLKPLAKPATKILDIGCGDGSRYGASLISAGIDLHGIDISDVAIENARKLGIKAQVAPLDLPLPFEINTFDSAICLEVFEHLMDPEFAAKEVHRILKPGGLFLSSVPNIASWRNRAELLFLGHFKPGGSPITSRACPWRDPHIRFFSIRAFRSMFQHAGFTVERQGGLDVQFLSPMPVARNLIAKRPMAPARKVVEAIGRRLPSLLAGRCVVLARKPSSTP